MEKKALILANRYGISTSANGICIENVVEELIAQDYSIYVITDAFDDETIELKKDRLTIFPLRAAWSKRIERKIDKTQNRIEKIFLSIVFAFKRMFSVFTYPNISPLRTKKLVLKATEIIDKYEIKKVICVYRPYDTISAGLSLKRIYGDKITLITYHLDILSSPENANSIIRFVKNIKNQNAINAEVKLADRIIVPPSAQKYIDCHYSKIKFADFPLFVRNFAYSKECNFEFDPAKFNVAYIGSLDDINRNPSELFRLIDNFNVSHHCNIEIHIWGIINGRNIEKEIMNHKHVHYHGQIDNKYTVSLLSKADALLNISNKVTYNMVPSKIFQMFSIKKPIINFVFNKQDASIKYFKDYGRTLFVYSGENSIDEKKLQYIIEYPIEINDEKLYELFYKSTPEYVVTCLEV